MRLFFAVDLPDNLAEAFAAAQEPFREANVLRFTDPSQAHVTLKFLGDVDEDRLPELTDAADDAVEAAGVDTFEMEVGGLGAFPSEEYISVLWVGVREGGSKLTRLHEALEAAMTGLGFDPEPHEFTPHFTLARMNHARDKGLVQRRLGEGDPTVGRFQVKELRLKASALTDDGPKYETVARFAL